MMNSADKMIQYILSDDAKEGVLEKIGYDLCNELANDPNAFEKIEKIIDSERADAVEAVQYAIDELFPGDARLFDRLFEFHRSGDHNLSHQMCAYLWGGSDLSIEKKIMLAKYLAKSDNKYVAADGRSFLESVTGAPTHNNANEIVRKHF